MEQTVFRCCKRKPAFFVQYSVAGFQKNYVVCSDCIKLECFSKYIIQKTPIGTQYKKNFQNEIFDEIDESEITDGKFDELVEQSENLGEQNENENHSQLVLKNNGEMK